MKVYDEICKAANRDDCIIGFNVFGYEDAAEIVRAAEDCNKPVILMTNRDAIKVLNLEHWSSLLRSIADKAKVTVGVHLDHCSDISLIKTAIDAGYTSVMYDGSKLPLEKNIENTKKVVDYAHKNNVMVEAEIGSVPYIDLGEEEIVLTDPKEACALVRESGTDILAVSIGNIHRLTEKAAVIHYDVLEEIERVVDVPLVIHGASGISKEDMKKLKKHRIGKINIGTALRMEFGNQLRHQMVVQPKEFDRLKLFAEPRNAIYDKVCEIFKEIEEETNEN